MADDVEFIFRALGGLVKDGDLEDAVAKRLLEIRSLNRQFCSFGLQEFICVFVVLFVQFVGLAMIVANYVCPPRP